MKRAAGFALPALLAGLILAVPAMAVSDPAEMLRDPAQEARAEALGSRLRCLVCQNESIEDSDASLARDLRRVLREHVAAGDSDRQIMRWMVDRYGSFVRLSPAFTAATALLWTMPMLALLAGSGIAILSARRLARAVPVAPLDPAEQARLDLLLRSGGAPGQGGRGP